MHRNLAKNWAHFVVGRGTWDAEGWQKWMSLWEESQQNLVDSAATFRSKLAACLNIFSLDRVHKSLKICARWVNFLQGKCYLEMCWFWPCWISCLEMVLVSRLLKFTEGEMQRHCKKCIGVAKHAVFETQKNNHSKKWDKLPKLTSAH